MSNSQTSSPHFQSKTQLERNGTPGQDQTLFIETTQPRNRNLFLWGTVILVVFAIVFSVVSTLFYRTLESRTQKVVLGPPSLDLQSAQQLEKKLLSSYGFVDKDQGIVHIPIQEAMRLEMETPQ